MPRAVVLLSGGLDSATTLAIARSHGFEAFALSVDYGQRHRVELDRAAAVAQALGAECLPLDGLSAATLVLKVRQQARV